VTADGDGLSARALASYHLLLVPTTVGVDEVATLVRARVPRGGDLATAGEVLLGRHSRLLGPFTLSMEDAVDAAVPMPWTVAYVLDSPVEREDPPLPDLDDRDGISYAFPEGLPWREEGRGLHLLVGLARRLGGVVRVAGSFELIQPDPARAVDYRLHAPCWLDPDVLLGIVLRDLPTARLALEGVEWTGPSEDAYSGRAVAQDTAANPLTTAELRAIHAAADEFDISVLSGEDVIDGYAVVGEVGPDGQDGAVEVFAHVAEGDEPSVVDQPWSSRPFVTYDVRWCPWDETERERRTPSPTFVAARRRVAPVVAAVTRSLVEATSGVLVDEDGFWYDRYRL
jgi:hypothetical protein